MADESLDVILSVGEVAGRIDTLPPLRGQPEGTVTVVFRIGEASVGLVFTPGAFLALAERLSRFARSLPGRPS